MAYGITETSSWITMTHPDDALELRVSTIGRSLACNEVKIVDPASGNSLSPDQQGELCTRGFLMKEYYKMPVEKHPKYYKFVPEFPMTGSGKVQKFRMAELAEKEYVDSVDYVD